MTVKDGFYCIKFRLERNHLNAKVVKIEWKRWVLTIKWLSSNFVPFQPPLSWKLKNYFWVCIFLSVATWKESIKLFLEKQRKRGIFRNSTTFRIPYNLAWHLISSFLMSTYFWLCLNHHETMAFSFLSTENQVYQNRSTNGSIIGCALVPDKELRRLPHKNSDFYSWFCFSCSRGYSWPVFRNALPERSHM